MQQKSLFLPLFAALLAGLVLRPGWAANPTISLRLRDVTLAEAAASLERATGTPIEGHLVQGPNMPAPAVNPEKRVSFDWTAATFGKALRELAGEYQVAVTNRPGGGYLLWPALAGGPPKTYRMAGAVERGGFRIGVCSVQVQRRSTVGGAAGSLDVEVGADALTGDTDAIGGVDNLVARDDRGNILLGSGSRLTSRVLPDSWSQSVRFDPPHSASTQLQWIEGDLIVYRQVTRLRTEVSLPLPEDGAVRQLGELTVRFLKVVPGKAEPPSDRIERQHVGPTVLLRVTGPGDLMDALVHNTWGSVPLLVGTSGRTYAPHGSSGNLVGPLGDILTYDQSFEFSAIDEPLKAAAFSMLQREQAGRVSFRLRDIPLPAGTGSLPLSGPWMFGARKGVRGSRWYDNQGGGLVSRVVVRGKPAARGTLYLGISPDTPDASPGIDWFEAPVGGDGVARLPDLKPGRYRILRLYRPVDSLPSQPGSWRNGEVHVEVLAGKDAAPPALEWAPRADAPQARGQGR